MIAGAVALACYSQITAWLLMRRNWSGITASLVSLAVWLALSLAAWFIRFRR